MLCSCGRIVSVTLVQYNVGVFDKYEGSSIAAVADIAKQLGADVISLNELDSCTVRTDKIALPRGNGYDPQAMAVVEYKDFIMASVHLDLTPESRMGQAEVINDYIDTYYADCMKPIFLAGDFNATPDSELIAWMKESCPLSPEQAAASDHLPVKITVHISHAEVQVLL